LLSCAERTDLRAWLRTIATSALAIGVNLALMASALARGFIEVDRADGSDVQALPLGRGQSHAGGEFVGAPTERLRDHGGDEFGALGFLHPGGGADEQRAYGRASGAYLAWLGSSACKFAITNRQPLQAMSKKSWPLQ
jgi:hypothetical protein